MLESEKMLLDSEKRKNMEKSRHKRKLIKEQNLKREKNQKIQDKVEEVKMTNQNEKRRTNKQKN